METESKILIYGLLCYTFGYFLYPLVNWLPFPINILLAFPTVVILVFVAKMITPWFNKRQSRRQKAGVKKKKGVCHEGNNA